jgi:hypothetical protein
MNLQPAASAVGVVCPPLKRWVVEEVAPEDDEK